MKIVGEKLEAWALREPDSGLKDDFGRSAFNRFYYATYLTTREMLGSLDAKWTRANHKAIPDLLEGAVKKPVKGLLERNFKKDLVSHGEKSNLLTDLNAATSDLANLMRDAYSIRCIADYKPEIRIELIGKVMILDDYKLTSARTWSNRAKLYCSIIRRVWKESGLA